MNKVPLKPLEYKVLIELLTENEQTKGGIFLPQSTIDRQEMAREVGVLVESGPLAFQDPDWIEFPKSGDKVFFDRYAGSLINIKGKKYRLINDKNIAGIVTGELEE